MEKKNALNPPVRVFEAKKIKPDKKRSSTAYYNPPKLPPESSKPAYTHQDVGHTHTHTHTHKKTHTHTHTHTNKTPQTTTQQQQRATRTHTHTQTNTHKQTNKQTHAETLSVASDQQSDKGCQWFICCDKCMKVCVCAAVVCVCGC